MSEVAPGPPLAGIDGAAPVRRNCRRCSRPPPAPRARKMGIPTARFAVNQNTLEPRFPGVYAVGDVTSVGAAKAGVFSEGAARVVAASSIAGL